jgi:hypothetical protein
MAITRNLPSVVVAFLIFFLVAAVPAFAGEAKGWYDGCCWTTDFHFTSVPGPISEGELRMRVRIPGIQLTPAPDVWWSKLGEVKGQWCASPDHCEDATMADIQVLKGSKRRLWGKYIVDFKGHHLEGRFSVRYRKRVPLCICE